MELSRHTKWVNDSGKATKDAIAQYQTIAASDPGPALLVKKKQDCDSQYPTAAHSHGAIGQNKKWRACYDDAQSAADSATSAYMAAVAPSAPAQAPASAAPSAGVTPAGGSVSAPASDNSMLYAGIGFLAIVAAILYFTQSKPATPAAA